MSEAMMHAPKGAIVGRLKSHAFRASPEKMTQDGKAKPKRLREAARSMRKGLRSLKPDT